MVENSDALTRHQTPLTTSIMQMLGKTQQNTSHIDVEEVKTTILLPGVNHGLHLATGDEA